MTLKEQVRAVHQARLRAATAHDAVFALRAAFEETHSVQIEDAKDLLDIKQFEAIASVGDVSFVRKSEEPTATIAKDLSKYVEDDDA